jgi:hypothetical protein
MPRISRIAPGDVIFHVLTEPTQDRTFLRRVRIEVVSSERSAVLGGELEKMDRRTFRLGIHVVLAGPTRPGAIEKFWWSDFDSRGFTH